MDIGIGGVDARCCFLVGVAVRLVLKEAWRLAEVGVADFFAAAGDVSRRLAKAACALLGEGSADRGRVLRSRGLLTLGSVPVPVPPPPAPPPKSTTQVEGVSWDSEFAIA